MPVLLLLFLTLVCLPDKWPAPLPWFASAPVSLMTTWLCVALVLLFAMRIARNVERGLTTRKLSREQALQRYLRGRRLHTISLFVTYGASLYLFGYGWAVHSSWSGNGSPLPGTELLLLAPFFVGLILSWSCFYRAERAFWVESHGPEGPPVPFFTRPAFVWFHLRQNLALVFLPVLLIVAEKEIRRFFPSLGDRLQTQASVVGAVVVLLVFFSMPWIIRAVLGLRPLSAGPLRDRLMATARRLNFRCNEILVWHTRGGIANAMVVGVLPFLRYVLLTDRLMEELSPDEVEAVFGHEIGHVKHHHMLYYLTFLLASMMVLGMLLLPWQGHIDQWLNYRSDLLHIPSIIALGLYIFLVFGFLSRRCERQADIYGCRAVSCGANDCAGHPLDASLPKGGRVLCATGILTFIQALEKVAYLNGISRDKPGFLQSWQHSTIARRVEFLTHLLRDPDTEPRFQRHLLLLKCGLFAVLGVILVVQFVLS